jgi:excisionase family DNA binding protein
LEITVRDAAERLGIGEPRVRQLLVSGDIAGRRLGRMWMVSAESVGQLQQRNRPPGRPLGPRRAWGLLDLLAGGEALWLPPSARSQLKARLRRLAEAGPDQWRAALRGRNEVVRCQAHPAAIPRLLSYGGVLPAGLGVLVCRRFDLTVIPRDIDQAYVDPALWPDISPALAIRTAGPRGTEIAPNLTVLLPRIAWPFVGRDELPDSVLAADLLETSEPRAVSAAAERLNELLRETLS